MFIIWGFGKQTIKSYGIISLDTCGRCNNNVQKEILKITTWFTLFFIPVIPYSRKYCLSCPICKAAQTISKQDFLELTNSLENAARFGNATEPVPDSIKYPGKNPTQIAYLKQMEEDSNRKQQNNIN